MNFKNLIVVLFISISLSCESEKFTTKGGETVELATLVGMDVFDVAYEYSNDSPQTLKGTNNNRWVVYFEDIDVTLEADKATNIIRKASKGKKPKG